MSRIGPVRPEKGSSEACTILALIVVAALASGCIDSGDRDALPHDDRTEEDPDPDPEPGPGADDDEGNMSWWGDVKEDRFTGSNVGVGIGNTTHTFTVEDNVTVMFFNFTTDGPELNLGIIDPECPDNTICGDETTQEGSLSHRVDEPSAGEWELWVRASELFHYEQPFRLALNQGSEDA